ncbi:HAD family hydrolase [Oceanobacillus manasiensis]|uniref:HAD family hydrolase n=1 Tax=Oceanobacillus manasiensis TaxID=586413 RepID=UPI0005A713C8|nr:HAD family hydrolase [Oceanobacillus manasiensis]
MSYKILFLDIDGTILKPDHTYTESTKNAIAEVKRQGVEVFLATGRPLHEIMDLAEELDVHSFVGYNGALGIYQEETIINETLKESTTQEFLKIAKEQNNEIVFYTAEKNYFTNMTHPKTKQFIDIFNLKQNEKFTEEITSNVLSGTLLNLQPEDVAAYEKEADIHLSQVNVEGAEHSYDIIRQSVNKGVAVERIMDRLGVRKEQTIAFGDGMNDKEMLQTVGEGFAMGNCATELLPYAKHQTTTVTESGIANGLKQLGLLK